MDAKDFGLSILEYFIANIPTIAIMVMSILNNFRKIKNEVSLLDKKVLRTENNIIDKVESKVNGVVSMVESRLNDTVDKVDTTLDKIENVVEGFANKIEFLETRTEQLVKTNKVAFDVISFLISGNDDFIDNGVASIVINKMKLSKEELEKYPNLLATDKEAFANAMKEQYVILGKENFEKFIYDTLMGIGDYGKEN